MATAPSTARKTPVRASVADRTKLAREARAARAANANGGGGTPSPADPALLAGVSTEPKRSGRKPTVVVGLSGRPADARGVAAVDRSRKATADAKAAKAALPKGSSLGPDEIASAKVRPAPKPAPKPATVPAPAASATRGPSKSEAKADLVRRVLVGIERTLADLPEDALALTVYDREEAGAAIAAMIHHFPAGRSADGRRWWPADGDGALPIPDRSDWR